MDRHVKDPSPTKSQLKALENVAQLAHVKNGNLPTGFVWKQCAVHRLMEDKGYLVLGVYTKRRCFNIAISPTGLVKVYDQTKRTDKDYMKKMAEGQ